MLSRKWSFTRYHSQHVKRNRECAPITTTFSRSRLRESKPLKPTLHKPPFRSVRFSRVHLPVLLYLPARLCRCLGLCDSRNDLRFNLSICNLRMQVPAHRRRRHSPKISVRKYLRRYLNQLDIVQGNRLYFENIKKICSSIFIDIECILSTV